MRTLAAIKSLCFIGVVLAFNQQLRAQVVETMPGPILETRPENGTPIAATAETYSIFHPPRGLALSVSATGGYDDNVNGSSGGSPSSYTSENAALSYTFGTPRTLVSLATGGGITYYFDHPGGHDKDTNAHLGLSLTHEVSRRMTLSLSVFASYQTQPDLSTSLGSNQQLGSYIHSADTISLAYSWLPRFSTVTSYTFDLLNYFSSAGSPLNRADHTFSEQFRYLLWPATTGVAEYRYGIVDYESAPQNSTTHYLLAGLDHSFTPRLNASFRTGAELRSSESSGFQPGPYFESTLTYILRHGGSVIWTNGYSIEEADQPGASSRPSFRTGLTLSYGFTRRISGSLALFYVYGGSQNGGGSSGNQSAGSSSSTENTFDIGPSIHYVINHRLSADVGYHYTKVESGSLSSYSKNNYFTGLNFNF
jgi:hypothetical protein